MKRAIGITRVSAEGDRETVHSYATQATSIERSCERDGMRLLYIGQERNVSGGANLASRPELSRAIAAIEAGDADVIVAAYFDRFFRSLKVQGEVIERAEKAGGEILALDHGQLTNATPAKRLNANLMGAIAQFYREQTGEKVRASHEACVADGKLPHPYVPLGYLKDADGRLERDPATAPLVSEIFTRRANGHTLGSLGAWMREQGHGRTMTGVSGLLRNRAYLGEIRFGEWANLTAHEPIVNVDVFDAVQRMKSTAGRPTLSEPRLLARLGVMVCSCGAKMAVGHTGPGTRGLPSRTYAHYRCAAKPPCDSYASISAPVAERFIEDLVRDALRDAQGRASVAEGAQEAISRLASAQAALDAGTRIAIRTGDESDIVLEELTALRLARDEAQAQVDLIGPGADDEIVDVADWDSFSFDLRRSLIRRVMVSATVFPESTRGARSYGEITSRIVPVLRQSER